MPFSAVFQICSEITEINMRACPSAACHAQNIRQCQDWVLKAMQWLKRLVPI
jgi:hypothetical protein